MSHPIPISYCVMCRSTQLNPLVLLHSIIWIKDRIPSAKCLSHLQLQLCFSRIKRKTYFSCLQVYSILLPLSTNSDLLSGPGYLQGDLSISEGLSRGTKDTKVPKDTAADWESQWLGQSPCLLCNYIEH